MKTGSLNCAGFKAKEASSKGFCILPRPKNPRSPSFLADEQSLNSRAISSNLFTLVTICSRYPKISNKKMTRNKPTLYVAAVYIFLHTNEYIISGNTDLYKRNYNIHKKSRSFSFQMILASFYLLINFKLVVN